MHYIFGAKNLKEIYRRDFETMQKLNTRNDLKNAPTIFVKLNKKLIGKT